MNEMQQKPILSPSRIESKVNAIDQLNVSACILKGVSDSLLALSEQPQDYRDAIRMFSDITMTQFEAINQVGTFLEQELSRERPCASTRNEVDAQNALSYAI